MTREQWQASERSYEDQQHREHLRIRREDQSDGQRPCRTLAEMAAAASALTPAAAMPRPPQAEQQQRSGQLPAYSRRK
jgi:hypothetical protein